jgi:hypothetical protein
MFRITLDPSSGSDNLYLIEITNGGSYVLIMCVIGVWQHILDCRKGELMEASSISKYEMQLLQ